MKKIDDSTLEVVAELICGSDGGSGSGYDTPGQYRTMGEIPQIPSTSGSGTPRPIWH